MIPQSFNFGIPAIQEIINLPTVPDLVKVVFNAVGLVFNVENNDWNKFKKEFIGEPSEFIKKVNNYDINSISRELYDGLEKKFTSIPEFNVEVITGLNKTTGELAKWVIYVRDRAAYKFKDMKPF